MELLLSRSGLKKNKITCKRSDAGRSTQQIIQTLGGFWGVQNIAHADIVNLLDEMSRKPITRSMQNQEFCNKINVATKKNIWKNNIFENLVENKAVELGLELKCTKCGTWS